MPESVLWLRPLAVHGSSSGSASSSSCSHWSSESCKGNNRRSHGSTACKCRWRQWFIRFFFSLYGCTFFYISFVVIWGSCQVHGLMKNPLLWYKRYCSRFLTTRCSFNQIIAMVTAIMKLNRTLSARVHTCCSSSAWLKGSSAPVQKGLRGETSPSVKWLCLESGEPGVCSNPLELFPSPW